MEVGRAFSFSPDVLKKNEESMAWSLTVERKQNEKGYESYSNLGEKRGFKPDGFVKSQFCSLREHFGRTSGVQLKC